jgi:hypothetical protein
MDSSHRPDEPFAASGRIKDLMLLRQGKLRPFSAVNIDSRAGRKASKAIPYHKEDLYDRVLQMKSEVNTVKTENTRLRTKVKQMETRATRRAPEDSPQLVSSLNRQIEELRKELLAKDEELLSVKRKVKCTKLNEMEAQLQVASDECTRLNRMLMEAMEDLGKGVAPQDLQERYYRLRADYKSLRREFFELSAYVQDGKHRSSRPGTGKRKVTIDASGQGMELHRSKERIPLAKCMRCGYDMNSSVPQFEAGIERKVGLIQRIWVILVEKTMTVAEFWQLLDPEDIGAIKPYILISALKDLGWLLSVSEADQLIAAFGTGQGESLHRASFEETLETEKPEYTDEQLQLIDHFSLRLQGLRMTSEDMQTLLKLPEPECTLQHLQDRLELSLLRLRPALSAPLAQLFFLGYTAMPTERIYARLTAITREITLLTTEQEAEFDANLRSLYTGLRERLLSLLLQVDFRSEGVIGLGQFLEISREIGVDVDESLVKYLRVLFYADRQELDVVPYYTFAQAFCTD